ncbi:tRNA uridine(34) 5-carboxymethylaminomethyl modification radical SAM/GNAT enzyme Elp3 [bacterium]|nr:tRNA uridine(34) 5-carboxymethylaminomethyl modification radical SAM/GNAT enzyme Elp3 [bacterium]MBT6832054.1 tRNA uridine(34) 5-carboxymethylaminomethyl modification radical SAM/GNAT enzyme Elp3 [bacterium]MBT6995835.1 tRNA uridine(34) 5-carboxymethylaminomethyl modification radical SAM/GNAT enzyme Elp3 [bacterium]MBT7772354.1 tRNA uridine(34) 5-carboxymethylaminomethyl modification radical SAM/GNAT enzyme Elp3 [bacterium]
MKKHKVFGIRQKINLPELVEKFLRELISKIPENADALEKQKRQFSAREKCDPILNRDLIVLAANFQISLPKNLAALLQKRAVRTISGVTPIGILTKPWPCPGRCVYCPTEVRMPKSYLSSQPAAARAVRNNFHPFRQVENRIVAIEDSGHPVSKLEVIVMGGTWSFLPKKYQSWFIKNIFDAANGKKKISNSHFENDEQEIPPGPFLKNGELIPDFLGTNLPYDPELKNRARELRKKATPAEKKLWEQLLRGRKFQNLRFLRQKPIDNFIVDFYCPELLLVLEIDGDIHDFQKKYDQERTEKLSKYGIEVVRYSNDQILSNIKEVSFDLARIVQNRKKQMEKSPHFKGDLGGFTARTLQEAQKINETADRRVIGLTLETRPDWITEKELIRMREFGCTRIEIGVQTLDDEIQKLTKRGHTRAHVARAMQLMRDFGFKICWHLMPGLPGSTPERDLKMMREVWENSDFRPDFVKIYPCQVLPNSELADWWRAGKFEPLRDKKLVELLLKFKKSVPPYTRIMRLLRDIPVGETLDGVKFSNLRQILKSQPKKLRELLGDKKFTEIFPDGHEWPCQCVRCREVGFLNEKLKMKNEELDVPILVRRNYEASNGTEVFLSFESPDKKVLYALLRLRKPSPDFSPKKFSSVLKNAALVREVHSYGTEVSIGNDAGIGQHRGLGKKLLTEAERIARDEWNLKKITVIAGVGTREYYRKLGYELRATYMTKKI